MSTVVDFEYWRERLARQAAAADNDGAGDSATFDKGAALRRSWREGRELLGAPEVSSYLELPLRSFDQAVEEIAAKRTRRGDS